MDLIGELDAFVEGQPTEVNFGVSEHAA